MSCSAAKKSIRTAITTGIQQMRQSSPEMSAYGVSRELREAVLQDVYKKLQTPNELRESLQSYSKDLDSELNTLVRTELGEVVSSSRGQLYLLGSTIDLEAETPTITLSFSPTTDISKVNRYEFPIGSDTGQGVADTITVNGLGIALRQAADKYKQKQRSDSVPETKIFAEGDTAVKNTLTKMRDSDRILFSRKARMTPEDLVGYERVKGYRHGNIESMKEMLHKLHVLGSSKASEATLRFYTKLLESLHERFFNRMDVYLKDSGTSEFKYVPISEGSILPSKKDLFNIPASEAELYLRDVVSTMVSWALQQTNNSTTKQKTQLNQAMKVVSEKTTWKDFIVGDKENPSQRSIRQAQHLRETLLASKNIYENFITLSLTNPTAVKVLKGLEFKEVKTPTNLYNKVINLFRSIIDVVVGRYDFKESNTNVFDKINQLAAQLGEVNNKHNETLRTLNPIGQVMETLMGADEYVADKLNTLRNKVKNTDSRIKVPEPNASVFRKAKFYLEVAVKGATNPLYRGFIGLTASSFGIKPNGLLREVVGRFLDRSEQFRAAEALWLEGNQNQTNRNSVINSIGAYLPTKFKVKPTDEEHKALKHVVIDTAMSSLMYKNSVRGKYTFENMVTLLTNGKELEGRITVALQKLESLFKGDSNRFNWTKARITDLSRFMVNGDGSLNLVFNPENIAVGVGLAERFTTSKEIEDVIRDLVIFNSLKIADTSEKKQVVILLKEEPEGLHAIMDSLVAFESASRDVAFKNDPSNMIMGYSKELFDKTLDIEVALVSEQKVMEKKGYKLIKRLEPTKGDVAKEERAIYSTSAWGRPERQAGAITLGKPHSKGTNLSTLKALDFGELANTAFLRDFANISNEAVKEATASFKTGLAPVSPLAPLYDRFGEVVDYRYLMNKREKEQLLNQDLNVFEVISRSYGDIGYDVATKNLNNKVLDFIKKDMKENWGGGELGNDNYSEYTLFSPANISEESALSFKMLPPEYQAYAESREDKTIAIRTELIPLLIGGHHLQLSNAIGLNLLPAFFKRGIDALEGMWMEFIKISKTAILLKMPEILVMNFVSSVVYLINTGSWNIKELITDHLDSSREVNEYINTNREIIALQTKIARDREALRRVDNSKELSESIKKDELEIRRLTQSIEDNPATELFRAGMFQSYIEDVGSSVLSETNRITEYIGKKIEKAPTAVKTAIDIAYFTQNTGWYKGAQEILQRSDMITRLVESKRIKRQIELQVKGEMKLPRWWLDSQPEGSPKKEVLTGKREKEFRQQSDIQRMRNLLDNYINYTLPNSPYEEWANRMGILMFTKYFKGIQRIIYNAFGDHPLKTTLTYLVTENVVDAASIQDSSLMVRGYGFGGGFSVGNIVPVYSPWYHIENLLVPPIAKSETYMGLF